MALIFSQAHQSRPRGAHAKASRRRAIVRIGSPATAPARTLVASRWPGAGSRSGGPRRRGPAVPRYDLRRQAAPLTAPIADVLDPSTAAGSLAASRDAEGMPQFPETEAGQADQVQWEAGRLLRRGFQVTGGAGSRSGRRPGRHRLACVTENLAAPAKPASKAEFMSKQHAMEDLIPSVRPARTPEAHPATRPGTRPDGKPARPATKPAARHTAMPKSRQLGAMRKMVATIVVCLVIGVTSGASEIWLHGFSFFLFRNSGAGAGNSRNLDEDQGPGRPGAPGTHHAANASKQGSKSRPSSTSSGKSN
jgi:hypothetical protein